METERIDKVISTKLCISRSDARRLICKKQVMLDGVVCSDFGARVRYGETQISAYGDVFYFKKYIYIIMNKPEGCCCTNDKDGRSVLELLPAELNRSDLVTVGRLDRDTTGLLIITNDGDFVHRVISPKAKIPKTYRATLAEPLSPHSVQLLQRGIALSDGTVCAPAIISPTDNPLVVDITIIEGKYHQVKRMAAAAGNSVTALQRLQVGGLELNELPLGQARELTEQQRKSVFVHNL